MPLPILTTERLTLRPLLLSDAQPVFALRSDSEINKYLDRQPSQTIEDARNFIKNIIENEFIYWAITWTENETFVGTICLFEFSDKSDKCEIGYELLSQFQGKGIMQEAAGRVIEYAVQTLKAQTIEAFTHKNNHSSTKLLKKLGFITSSEADEANSVYCVFTFSKGLI
jgi:ribosomal-protein-alanine N-acetyltransferase